MFALSSCIVQGLQKRGLSFQAPGDVVLSDEGKMKIYDEEARQNTTIVTPLITFNAPFAIPRVRAC